MSVAVPPGTRLARVRASLTRREWTSMAGMTVVIVGLHVIGWGVLAGIVAPAATTWATGRCSASDWG